MADNATLNSGSGGITLALDDIAGVHHQRVKVQFGVDGSATDVSASNGLPVTQQGTWNVAVDLGANNDVTIDGSAVIQTEDAVHNSGDTGIMPLAVRNDALAALAGTDGDYAPLQVDASGSLYVTGGGGGTQYTEGDTDASITGTAALMEVAADTLQPIQGTVADGLLVNLGTNNDVTATNAGTFAVQVDGAALTALQILDDSVFVDDAAFTLASSSVTVAGAIRDDTLGTLTAIEGDAVPLRVSSTGALHVTGGGGGTQYSVDDAGPTVVTMAGVVRDDALTTLTEVDGDATLLRVNSTGALHVTGGGGGTQYSIDDAGPTVVTMAGVVRDDALTTLTEIDGDATVLRVSSTGALHVTGGGGGTEYTEDVAAAADPVGGAIMLVREDARAGSLTSTDGDNVALRGNNSGEAYVIDTDANALLTTIDADTGAIKTAVELIDNAVSGAGFNITQLNGAAVPIGAGVEATAVRVTVATDSTGVLTVDGTITANLGATDNAVLDTIATNTTGLAGTVAGSELQVDIVAALPAGTNAIGKLAANSGVDIGDVDVLSIAAGANLIGDVGISGARTSGGTTIFRSIDLDETEEEVKATAGQLYWLHCMNLSAAVVYLKIYNATAATVVVGTTPPVLTFPIATQGDTNGAGFVLSIPNGIAFGTAITVAATTGIADADTGAPAANVVVLNLGYA